MLSKIISYHLFIIEREKTNFNYISKNTKIFAYIVIVIEI